MKYYLVVIDSFGIGADEKAGEYGDAGSNTVVSAAQARKGEKWSFLGKMGLGNCTDLINTEIPGCAKEENPLGSYGVLRKASPGKDTQTGHWEIAGLRVDKPMVTFPGEYPSFPKELIERIERETGRRVLGNYAASGTEIIKVLGREQAETEGLIVYTSADSVLQIAANEENIPHEELHEICRKVRKICDDYGIGRVIARPYIGNEETGYTRTKYRKDFSVELPGKTIMDEALKNEKVSVTGVGKIGDIFNNSGIDINFPDKGNGECLARCMKIADGTEKIPDRSFVFINLVDTDMLYGHRRDPAGYEECIEQISVGLEKIYGLLEDGDVLAVTADHGCDPCFAGTDHTREYVPFLRAEKGKYGKPISKEPIEGFDFCAKDVVKYFRKE